MTLISTTGSGIDGEGPSESLMLPIEGVAKLLGGVSVRTIERMVRRKEFPPPRKLGRRTLWSLALVERWANDPDAMMATVAPPAAVVPAHSPIPPTDQKPTPPEQSSGTPPAPAVPLVDTSVPPTAESAPRPDPAARRVVGEILAAVFATRPTPAPRPMPTPFVPVPAPVKPPQPVPMPPIVPPSRLPPPSVIRPAPVVPPVTVPAGPRPLPGSVPHPAAVAPSRLGTVPTPVRPPTASVPPRPTPAATILTGSVPNRPEPPRR